MGAFTERLGSWLSDTASKGVDKLAGTDVGGKLIDYAGSKAMEYSRSPQGRSISKMVDDFKYRLASGEAEMSQPHSALFNGIQRDTSTRNSIDLNKPLGDIHQQLTATNHPLRASSAILLSEDPNYAKQNAAQIMSTIQAKARLQAITDAFGPHMQNVLPLIVELQDHADPRVNTHAIRLLDNLSNDLKDTIKKPTSYKNAAKGSVSSVKTDITKNLTTLNRFRNARIAAGEKDVKRLRPEDISTNPTYKAPGSIEKAVSEWVRLVQVPLVAIPHIGTYFNLGTAPLRSMGKVLLGMSDKDMNAMIYASGALSGTMHDIMHAHLEGRTGLVSKLPFGMSPSVGEMLYKGIHTPGFNYLREKQLWLGAALGYHSTIEWAAQSVNGNKRAIAELTEMGLDAAGIAKRGGKLTQEELQKGIFHFTDNRLFINRLQSQSLHANENIFMRSATMYHSFLNAQVSFMRREAMKMLKTGDMVGLAQFAGTLGILFPSIAPALSSLELLGRTGSPAQAKQELQNDYTTLAGAKGGGAAAREYLDLLCHVGGVGVFQNYVKAAGAHRLQSAALGPLFSTPLSALEDAANAVKTNQKGTHNFKPILRDTAQDLLPLIGKPVSHILAPTDKEQPRTKSSRRGRRR